MKKELEDKLIDTILEEAFSDEMLKDIDSIPDEPVETSAEFEARMNGLIKSSGKKRIRPAQALKRAAVILLCFLSVSFIAIMFSPEVRASVQQIFLKVYDRFTSFDFKTGSSQIMIGNYVIKDMPSNYSLLEKHETDTDYFYVFGDADGNEITLHYGPRETVNLSIDNERHTQKEIQVNGNEGYLFEPDSGGDRDNSIVMWVNGETVFLLEGDPVIKSGELLKIADSVKGK